MKKCIALFVFLFGNYLVHAQNMDINILKNINPQNPNNIIWRGATGSAYPVSIGVPAGIWLVATIEGNSTLQQKAYAVGSGVILSAGVAELLKLSVNRARPYTTYPQLIHPFDATESGYSLPSGHVSLAFANATGLALSFKKWYITVPAFTWATAVGYSRLYLGEHYPSDVVIGAAVGSGSAWLSHWLTEKYFQKRKNIRSKR
ncbi:phosphatase PAP2 family protein [Hydrotalea sp.]|uniref:phosphatase PAP2 family protein n=1 Tax=Hydrotalea sp. TaxID=2881279 RepID=UPI0026130AD7|nr:phosphatase PAP2 family protein [Hydrotalea sp.]